MLPRTLRHNPGRVRAIIYAVLVHAVIIGLAIIGFRWTVDSPSSEKVIQATAVSEPPIRHPEEDKKRAQENEAQQKSEADKRRQNELKKKQDEEQAQQRLITERKKKEAEEKERQKRAADDERKNEQKRRQKLTEQSLQEQLEAEEKARQQAAHTARTASEVDKYRSLIGQRVSRSWNRPMGVAKGLKCVVSVRLAPGGEVLSANVVRSSGNATFDRSVENAVYKAAPLPLPEDPTLFNNFREIEFLFNPEE
ncbi:MAG: cell envelope integrity protein TolA [Sulfuricaulis sp.]|uniref:cell envelope integrity protein TolA n=1 Tax=Sulfuricaulis sp. TaxID=2003553 RepID=UPI0025F8B5D3|nr:cell envelope integrity protein TolA [Sulfuricaulis sp.]MCR4347190.1 cell envelope integrity protein TolA [Sulfuricaulis sp.]